MKHLDPSHGGALTLCLLLAASCGGGTSAPADPGDAARLDPRPGTGPVRSLLLKAEARDALGLVLKQAELRGRGPLLEFPGAIEPAFRRRAAATIRFATSFVREIAPIAFN